MNNFEKIDFVVKLAEAETKHMIDLIEKGKIPCTWEGLELRQFLADHLSQCISESWKRNRKRRTSYNNDILVCGL